jgi:malate/lactate dehydrogenase
MGIAYAMFNQVSAGTIALVDMNKNKLEGEAKDLKQGSAFHQHVRYVHAKMMFDDLLIIFRG